MIIVGAGAAGLSAMRTLDRAGKSVLCLEARDRIGGRILTLHKPTCALPIELGAEFIHGRPPETWQLVQEGALAAYDCGESSVHLENGEVREHQDAWLMTDTIMDDMTKAAEAGPDVPFATFVSNALHDDTAKQLATSFVQGFNAARADEIGIASLAQDTKAAAAIDGDRSFRLFNGYDAVPQTIAAGISDLANKLHLHSVVDGIVWQPGNACVHVRSTLTGEQQQFAARCVIVSVPLGVLQAQPPMEGAIRFDPIPGTILQAAQGLRFGQVIRTVLQFQERVWEWREDLADIGFLLSSEPEFPTWWTPLPMRTPIITGWSAGPKADSLLGLHPSAVIKRAVEQLARVTGIGLERLEASLIDGDYHDWHSDSYARGAYSYTPAGALPARDTMAQPVQETLFFAGEATENRGHSGTVHGAIATGTRAAQQVLSVLG